MPSKRSNPKAYLFPIRDNTTLARRFVDGFDYDQFRDNQLVFYAVTRALVIISEASRRRYWISSGCGSDTGDQRSCHREGNVQQRQRPFDFGVETFRRLGRLGEIIVASQKATHRMEARRAVDLDLLLASASNIVPIFATEFCTDYSPRSPEERRRRGRRS
jgi:hypothetical protein